MYHNCVNKVLHIFLKGQSFILNSGNGIFGYTFNLPSFRALVQHLLFFRYFIFGPTPVCEVTNWRQADSFHVNMVCTTHSLSYSRYSLIVQLKRSPIIGFLLCFVALFSQSHPCLIQSVDHLFRYIDD